MAVSIPGVILSSLMFDMKNSPGDTVGFLLGKTHRYSVSTITDTQIDGTREEKKICIQEYVVVKGRHSFTDKKGRVDFNQLDQLLENRLESVVGWFTYRCNSSHQLSIMEKNIHRHLMTELPHSPGSDLVFGLFSEHTPDDPGLHTMEHSFSQWVGSCPQLVHVDIVNLKSTSTMPYHPSPLAPIPPSVETYHDLLTQNRSQLLTDEGNTIHSLAMEDLFKDFQQKFDPLQVDLRKSYKTITGLEDEIREMKENLNKIKQEEPISEPADKGLNTKDTTTNEELPPLISFSDEIIPDDHSDNKPIPNSNNPTSSSEQWALITDDEDITTV